MDGGNTTDVVRDALAGGRAGVASNAALDRLYERARRAALLHPAEDGARLRARLESRDILQATFLKSFQHLDDFEGQDGRSLMAWLMRIAEHEIRDRADFHHRQQRDAAREDRLDDRSPSCRRAARSALSQRHPRRARPSGSRRRSNR